MKKNLSIILLLILPYLFFSCEDDDSNNLTNPIDLIVDDYDNIPVKVNTQDSFTFTLNAKNFSYTTEDNLQFSDDSIVVTITLTNASSNNSSFVLIDTEGNVMYSESLNENKVSVDTDLIGNIPSLSRIELNNFTGQLTIVVAVNKGL